MSILMFNFKIKHGSILRLSGDSQPVTISGGDGIFFIVEIGRMRRYLINP